MWNGLFVDILKCHDLSLDPVGAFNGIWSLTQYSILFIITIAIKSIGTLGHNYKGQYVSMIAMMRRWIDDDLVVIQNHRRNWYQNSNIFIRKIYRKKPLLNMLAFQEASELIQNEGMQISIDSTPAVTEWTESRLFLTGASNRLKFWKHSLPNETTETYKLKHLGKMHGVLHTKPLRTTLSLYPFPLKRWWTFHMKMYTHAL